MAGTVTEREGSGGTAHEASLERLQRALDAAAEGDFGVRLPGRRKDAVGDLERAFNRMAERQERLTGELDRVARQIGREGRMTERARVDEARGQDLQRLEPSTA